MRAAEAAAAGLADGPEQVYGPLARALIRAAQVPLRPGGRSSIWVRAPGLAGRAALAARLLPGGRPSALGGAIFV